MKPAGQTDQDGRTLPPRILVVDDDRLIRALVRRHLPSEYEVTECGDAESAYRAAQARTHDAALVDVEMPGMDGFALCRQLCANPLSADMPVIMVTAKSGIEDLERGFEAGATDYIRKPFNPRELHARVRNAVELKLRRDSSRRWQERIAHDLAMAGALQRRLLSPRPLLRPDLRVFTAYQPSIEVGGDLFDMIPLPDGRIALYVGDVAGHGVGAALAGTFLKASLVELLHRHVGAGPSRIANELHHQFVELLRTPSLYATLFLAFIDPATRRWRCLNCGHPDPVFVGVESTGTDLPGGPPVGFALAPANPFGEKDESEFVVEDGAAVLLVTDGLLEARCEADPGLSPREVLGQLVRTWQAERGSPAMEFLLSSLQGAGFFLKADDCTAMLVEHVAPREVVFEEEILPFTTVSLTRLAARMEEHLLLRDWPEEAAWAAHLLLVEHGANVLEHGNPPAGSSLLVQVRAMPHALEILVEDQGTAWDYEMPPGEAPDAQAPSGRGLLMIRRIASYMACHRAEDRNFSLFGIRKEWTMAQ